MTALHAALSFGVYLVQVLMKNVWPLTNLQVGFPDLFIYHSLLWRLLGPGPDKGCLAISQPSFGSAWPVMFLHTPSFGLYLGQGLLNNVWTLPSLQIIYAGLSLPFTPFVSCSHPPRGL